MPGDNGTQRSRQEPGDRTAVAGQQFDDHGRDEQPADGPGQHRGRHDQAEQQVLPAVAGPALQAERQVEEHHEQALAQDLVCQPQARWPERGRSGERHRRPGANAAPQPGGGQDHGEAKDAADYPVGGRDGIAAAARQAQQSREQRRKHLVAEEDRGPGLLARAEVGKVVGHVQVEGRVRQRARKAVVGVPQRRNRGRSQQDQACQQG